MNSHEVFIHIHQGCFAGTGAIVRLPQCQWSKPDGYGKISQCITTTKHSKAKTVCIFLGIYCTSTRICLVPNAAKVYLAKDLAQPKSEIVKLEWPHMASPAIRLFVQRPYHDVTLNDVTCSCALAFQELVAMDTYFGKIRHAKDHNYVLLIALIFVLCHAYQQVNLLLWHKLI